MKMNVAFLLAIALSIALPVLADVGRDAAAATAQKLVGGRVLAIEKVQKGGRDVWRVKVVTTHGEVQLIYIDAETGKSV